jgi:hypothetical protein
MALAHSNFNLKWCEKLLKIKAFSMQQRASYQQGYL